MSNSSANDPAAPDRAQFALVQQLFVQNSAVARNARCARAGSRRVDDLVQETFLTVTAKAAAFREGTQFSRLVFHRRPIQGS